MKNNFHYLLVFLLLSSCHFGDYSEIKTKKELSNYTRKLYNVDVCVWVRDWEKEIITLEYYEYAKGVTSDSADAFIAQHLPIAQKVKAQVDNTINQKQ